MNCAFLVKWIKFSVKKKQNIKKILEKWQQILEKSGKSQGILSVWKVGTLYCSSQLNILEVTSSITVDLILAVLDNDGTFQC